MQDPVGKKERWCDQRKRNCRRIGLIGKVPQGSVVSLWAWVTLWEEGAVPLHTFSFSSSVLWAWSLTWVETNMCKHESIILWVRVEHCVSFQRLWRLNWRRQGEAGVAKWSRCSQPVCASVSLFLRIAQPTFCSCLHWVKKESWTTPGFKVEVADLILYS